MPGYSFSEAEYRYGFQNQKIDKELWDGTVSYKYRIEDPRLGRFFSVDPLAPEYPHNSPFAFSENRIMDAIELEGLEAYFIHGTKYAWGVDFSKDVHSKQLDPKVLEKVGGFFGTKTINQGFNWNGLNSDFDRTIASSLLVMHILATRTGDEPIVLLAHSHGGTVAIMAANILVESHKIPPSQVKIIALNTPREDEAILNNDIDMYAVSAIDDYIQQYGSDHPLGSPDVLRSWLILYEDQISEENGDKWNHTGVDPSNTAVWVPLLEKEVRRNKTILQESTPTDLKEVEIEIPVDATATKRRI